MSVRTYTDAQLEAALGASHSWRGVLRCLGLNGTSAGSMRSVRRRADELGLCHDHFTGQRRWSDRRLASAIESAESWSHLATLLQLVSSGGTLAALRAHAVRLDLATAHLESHIPEPSIQLMQHEYRPAFLRDAGSLFAATWFTLRGARIAWPLEPCRYDLVADLDGDFQRVQVKTTTGYGASAVVQVSNSRRAGRIVYAPGEIDSFFVLDASLTAYLIPYSDVAGYGQLQLGNYSNFVVVDQGQLIPSACVSPEP